MSRPRIIHGVAEFRAACAEVRGAGQRLGFVPTMGALHRGHLRLVEAARRHADCVALSIFVNPTQFGPQEDFSRYPRTLESDVDLAGSVGTELVFAPAAEEIYPPGEGTRVLVGALGEHLCGPFRPGHFQGVATVVAKLFAVAGECTAVFGRKDYQQLKIVERMAADLLLPVRVVGEATVRDPDGLALSSRNTYLSAMERMAALAIPRALAGAAAAFARGERRSRALIEPVRATVTAAGLRLQYADIADPDQLLPLGSEAGARALIAVAAFCGTTRLIDNLVLGEDVAPLVPES